MILFNINTRCLIVLGLAFCVTTILGQRLVELQIQNHDDQKKTASFISQQDEPIPAHRGCIVDAKDNRLVNNDISYSLIADQYHLKDPRIASLGLAYIETYQKHADEWEQLDEKEKNKLFKETRKELLVGNKEEEKEKFVSFSDSLGHVCENLTDLFSSKTQNQKRDSILKAEQEKKEREDLIVTKHELYAISIISQRLNIPVETLKEKLENDSDALESTMTSVSKKNNQETVQPSANKSKPKRIIVAKGITEDQMESLREDFKTNKIQGFSFECQERRNYVMPALMPHIIGYTNAENVGQMGVEKAMDGYLTGQDGNIRITRDARGLPIPSERDKYKPAVNGLNIRLTIDSHIQTIVEEEMDTWLATVKAKKASVILVNPNNGDILAMASRPTFNLNERDSKDFKESSLNVCTQATLEPGSTFKTGPISAAIEHHKVSLETPINCGGGKISEGGITLSDTHAYGGLKVWEVIQKSSNIGAYRIAARTGRKIVIDHLRNLGFGQRTNIKLSGEIPGRLNSGENPVDFSRVAIGYAVEVTPIQMAMMYSAVANGGNLMEPRIVNRIYDDNNKTLFKEVTDPHIVRRVMSEDTAAKMRKALASVTAQGGTGARIGIPGCVCGGKTGTARAHVEGAGYLANRYNCSFIGIVPIEKPKFVCLVIIFDPLTDEIRRFGGTIAGPLFKNIGIRVCEALNIPHTAPKPEDPTTEQSKSEKHSTSSSKSSKQSLSKKTIKSN